ncbi:hypothetical protein JCM17960_33390 [Magnetospira thiophila]
MRKIPLVLAVSLFALPTLAAPGEQTADSGKPLAIYCNSVPHLAVQRSDSVDNWVRICTIWLNATQNKLSAEEVQEALRKQAETPDGKSPQ